MYERIIAIIPDKPYDILCQYQASHLRGDVPSMKGTGPSSTVTEALPYGNYDTKHETTDNEWQESGIPLENKNRQQCVSAEDIPDSVIALLFYSCFHGNFHVRGDRVTLETNRYDTVLSCAW